MTEQEWLVCNDPERIYCYLKNGFDPCMGVRADVQDPVPLKVSDRKLRLFAYAWREVANMPNDHDLDDVDPPTVRIWHGDDMGWVQALVGLQSVSPEMQADLFREIFNPFWRRVVHLDKVTDGGKGGGVTVYAGDADPRWLTWHDGTVPKLAESIYQDKAWERMPILADALEEAGCIDVEILNHSRGLQKCSMCVGLGASTMMGPVRLMKGKKRRTQQRVFCCGECRGVGWLKSTTSHYRGCWVLDLLTGKN